MDGIGEVFKMLASLCLFLQLAKRWKDSDRDDFLDDFGSENEGDLHTRKLKSPPAQQVRKEEGLLNEEGKREEGKNCSLSSSMGLERSKL